MSDKVDNLKNSILFKNIQDKAQKIAKKEKTSCDEDRILRPRAVRLVNNNDLLKISNMQYDPTVNYYEEYWKIICENEYLIALIKENLAEIEAMKTHIEFLKK